MATVKLYFDTRREKKDGTFPIKLVVRHRERFMLNTPFSARETEWDGNEYSRRAENYRARNASLRMLFSKAESIILSLERSEEIRGMTDRMLKAYMERELLDRQDKGENFLHYMDEFIARKETRGTKEIYLMTRRKIEEYDPGCTFETMDRRWLERFEARMAETMKVNACGIHLRNIRAVFNYALDEEYTTLYPFRKFKIKKEATRKRSLTVEQLRTLRDYPCEEHQRRYRDLFMLMFYLIGINAADLFLTRKSQLVNGRIEYVRAKTHKLYSVKVEPEAQAIIDRYAGRGEYLLNVMDEYSNYKDFLHRMGLALKQIGQMERRGLGGKKIRTPLFPELSSYWSRHTWATMAAELEIPIETISEALGHEYGCRTTSIYIAFDKRKVDVANRQVIDYVNGE